MSRGRGCRTDGKCKRCENSQQTIEHTFLECPVAIETWIHFKPILLSLASESFNVNSQTVFLRMLPNKCSKDNRPVVTYLIKVRCYFIWKCGCKYVYEKKIKISKQIISEIRREVRDRCQIAFNTARRDSGLSLKL